MRKIENVGGINYHLPQVLLLGTNGIGNAEYAARTCYDSFDKSEHDCFGALNHMIEEDEPNKLAIDYTLDEMKGLETSELLERLSFVAFHHSVLEHNVMTFFIKGTSRGVLQELARHRIASYSVRSTRYTLDAVLYNFILARIIYNSGDLLEDEQTFGNYGDASLKMFVDECLELDLFVTADDSYNAMELSSIYMKLEHQLNQIGSEEFMGHCLPKTTVNSLRDEVLSIDDARDLMFNGKKKRNAGDKFKHVITDNFKVDLTMTINLRSLQNFLKLRMSGSAWFQIQWLANAMKDVMPQASKRLIFKDERAFAEE